MEDYLPGESQRWKPLTKSWGRSLCLEKSRSRSERRRSRWVLAERESWIAKWKPVKEKGEEYAGVFIE
jgi:hypothetical protein